MKRWQRAFGTFLVVLPTLALLALFPLGVMLGALGMDVHINSKASFVVLIFLLVGTSCACIWAGIRLRRSAKLL